MTEAKKLLKEVFGYDDFRPPQDLVIARILSGEPALVLMPTGMGKSLCFQIPARLLGGTTLVISPLISLMKDQVDALKRQGFRAAFINSTLSSAERERRYRKLANGDYELVYVTPERFLKPEFRTAVQKCEIRLLAVDEAHCISTWGHDFRPDYTRVGEFRKFLDEPTTIALTATATREVKQDIIKQLGFASGEVEIYDAGIQRPNLHFSVDDLYGLDSKLDAFVKHFRPGEPTIVYFSLIDTLRKFDELLYKRGIRTLSYHGQLGDSDRRCNQEIFLRGNADLILATPAFGLGIHKPDIRLVVHAELPGSLEAYYQEAGRAGRDGESSRCILLYDEDDIATQMDFIKWSNPDPEFVRSVYQKIENDPVRVNAQGAEYLREQMNFYNRRDFRVETALGWLQRWDCVEGDLFRRDLRAVTPPTGAFVDVGLHTLRIRGQREKLLNLVRYVQTEGCREKAIGDYFGQLDLPGACGRCDRCIAKRDR